MNKDEEQYCIVHMIRIMSMIPTLHMKEAKCMYQTCEKLRRIEAEGYSYSDDELFEEFLDRVERLERGVRDYEK